jgi:hypothetical protein
MVWRSVRKVDCFGSSNAAKYASTSCWEMVSVSVTRSRTVKVTSGDVRHLLSVSVMPSPPPSLARAKTRLPTLAYNVHTSTRSGETSCDVV